MLRGFQPMRRVEIFNALHKCNYPQCVGQPATKWVLSPLGLNILLPLLKERVNNDKYSKINNAVKAKDNFNINTALFFTPKFKEVEKLKKLSLDNAIKMEVDLNEKNGANSVNQWVRQQHGLFENFEIGRTFSQNASFALLNVCSFQSTWKSAHSNTSGRFMKIHNSFNYTQDVNYEARIIELQMADEDFRLIVLVPNEVDLLCTLFRRLTNEGVAATFASIQPLFSIDAVFKPPDIDITSQISVSLNEDKDTESRRESLIQYGVVTINENNVNANVLSCLYSTETKPSIAMEDKTLKEKAPFFFAITYRDTPIFTGQYYPP